MAFDLLFLVPYLLIFGLVVVVFLSIHFILKADKELEEAHILSEEHEMFDESTSQ